MQWHKVIIFCKSHPLDCQIQVLTIQGTEQYSVLLYSVYCPTYSCHKHLVTFEFRFQPVQMSSIAIFSANFWINFSIGNITLSCLENLVCVVWIPVWVYAKQQGCEWNISVLKNSLKIGFEFRFQRVNTSCGAMFGILKNTILVIAFVIAVWILIWVSEKYLSIWSINDEMPAVWKLSL